MSEEIRSEMRVHCGKCSHEWVVAYLPMEMGVVATVLQRAMCPSCGAGSKSVFLGRKMPARCTPATCQNPRHAHAWVAPKAEPAPPDQNRTPWFPAQVTLIPPCDRCGVDAADQVAHALWHERLRRALLELNPGAIADADLV